MTEREKVLRDHEARAIIANAEKRNKWLKIDKGVIRITAISRCYRNSQWVYIETLNNYDCGEYFDTKELAELRYQEIKAVICP